MKKLVLGCCLALVLSDGECWGMNRSKSDPVFPVATGTVEGREVARPSSAPVTKNEIENAISKWSYLVPTNENTEKVCNFFYSILSDETKMKQFVQLICEIADERYASFASLVFADSYAKNESDERSKCGAMLADIRNFFASKGRGIQASLFWTRYQAGYYDPED